MDYNFSTLNDESFQKLCQAVIVRDYPNAQSLPVGQPDGGKDAFVWRAGSTKDGRDLTVFQVKFSRNPDSKDERVAIQELIATESTKVKVLIEKGLINYFFMTNVAGTSHPDVGSIDRVDQKLKAALGVNAICLWRDDISRRIDGAADIKWSYPEIIRATDLLQALVGSTVGEDAKRRQRAIAATVNAQYRADLQVRFKEIELNFPLMDLFVDTLAEQQSLNENDQKGLRINPGSNKVFAANYLLNTQTNDLRETSIVLQGAPGQGKSTITQYVCQVHRLRFLGKTSEFQRLKGPHRNASLKLPIRADLRDFASWLEGRVAFGVNSSDLRPTAEDHSLEAFLAALVHNASGGLEFSVNDLHSILEQTCFLLALDGFDEVADVSIRDRMIEEIEFGVSRIRDACQSVQVIVTSRPSAFNNSSRFDTLKWRHIDLLDLSSDIIGEYSHKWAKVRKLNAAETSETVAILNEKLVEPHIIELARNPMQLSILLSLILKQGPSLPNKRTELYSDYIKLFFDREAQKSAIVKRHRALLISVHEYLAFMLHADAEIKGDQASLRKVAPGTTTLSDLKRHVGNYLVGVGHPVDLLDGLYVGITERVVALVSRKQGTYEFPVQPLREYFAAQHLYKTATVRPGAIAGSRPQRFRALAQRSYWSNVLRFYSGCYHSGELPSLVEETYSLDDAPDLFLKNMGRRGALAIMSDYVFQDQPRLISRYVDYIFAPGSLDLLLSWVIDYRLHQTLSLPEDCGRAMVFARAADNFRVVVARDRRSALAQILYFNGSGGARWEVLKGCKELFSSDDFIDAMQWMRAFEFVSAPELAELENELGHKIAYCAAVSGRWEYIFRSQVSGEAFIDQCVKSGQTWLFSFVSSRGQVDAITSQLIKLFAIFGLGRVLSEILGLVDKATIFADAHLQAISQSALDLQAGAGFSIERYSDIVGAFEQAEKLTIAAWLESIHPISSIVEASRAVFGEVMGLVSLAGIGVGLSVSNQSSHVEINNQSAPLCGRLLTAKSMADNIPWWSRQVEDCQTATKPLLLYAFFTFGSLDKLGDVWEAVQAVSSSLPNSDFAEVLEAVDDLDFVTSTEQTSWPAANPTTDSRMLGLTIARCGLRIEDEVVSACLESVKTADIAVVQIIIRALSFAVGKSELKWEVAIEAFSLAHKRGADVTFFQYAREIQKLPAELVQRIVLSPSDYPLSLIKLADDELLTQATKSKPTLHEVSEEENWFAET